MQGRRVAIARRGLFQNLKQSAGSHFKHFITEAGLTPSSEVLGAGQPSLGGSYFDGNVHVDFRLLSDLDLHGDRDLSHLTRLRL